MVQLYLRFSWMATVGLPATENDPLSQMTVNKLEEALGAIKLEDDQWKIQDPETYSNYFLMNQSLEVSMTSLTQLRALLHIFLCILFINIL